MSKEFGFQILKLKTWKLWKLSSLEVISQTFFFVLIVHDHKNNVKFVIKVKTIWSALISLSSNNIKKCFNYYPFQNEYKRNVKQKIIMKLKRRDKSKEVMLGSRLSTTLIIGLRKKRDVTSRTFVKRSHNNRLSFVRLSFFAPLLLLICQLASSVEGKTKTKKN